MHLIHSSGGKDHQGGDQQWLASLVPGEEPGYEASFGFF